MAESKFYWEIAGLEHPTLGCIPGGGVQYTIRAVTAENARLLHIIWNKVVLEHAPTNFPPVERSAIDDEADAPDGKAASRASLAEASWWVSFCTAGIYRISAKIVWESTLNHVKHVETKDRLLTTERWPTKTRLTDVVHKDPACAETPR